MSDKYRYFRVEARDLLDRMGRGVLELERGAAAEGTIPALLRMAHTLKGAARVVRQSEIAEIAHQIEDALAPWREQAVPVPSEQVGVLAGHLTAIAERLALIGAPAAAEQPAGDAAPPVETLRLVRAEVGDVDAIVEGLGAAQVQIASVRRIVADVERARRMSESLDARLEAGPIGGGRPRGAMSEGVAARGLARDLRALMANLERRLSGGLDSAERDIADVRAAAERLRLMPASAVLDALERVARDGARTLRKSITFDARGRDLRLDAGVLGLAQGALVQLVRNAVAHGLEPDAERSRAGKPAAGRVEIVIERRAAHVVFSCRDDGRGVDLDAVRRAAQRSGVLPAGAAAMGAAELLSVMMRGGISTSSAVTELSGRGVGLDVVRDAAARLGGEVKVETAPKQGTCVELWVPHAVSSLDALVAEHEGRTAAIPIEAVRRAARVAATEGERGELFIAEEGALPFASLGACLGSPSRRRVEPWSVVVIGEPGDRAAIGVDRVIGLRHVVVRPLPELAAVDRLVVGAFLDERGDPIAVLDPGELARRASRAWTASETTAERPLPILIIDDSLTTRMLEQSILESAGLEVDLASSAEEGMEKARARRYACFLVDVEMPGMDGFDFVELTRRDAVLREIPAILITSRSSAEDRARGARAGASGYIVKSEFDQGVLLARIRELVGGA